MMKYIIIGILVFLSSCHFFGPIDEKINTENIKIEKEDLVGKWILDKFSYQYFFSELNENDSILLVLNSNSSFEMNSSFIIFRNKPSKIDNPSNSGSWELKGEFNSSILVLNFEEDNTQVELRIFQKEKELQLWYFLGDPDSGERLRFLK